MRRDLDSVLIRGVRVLGLYRLKFEIFMSVHRGMKQLPRVLGLIIVSSFVLRVVMFIKLGVVPACLLVKLKGQAGSSD